MRTTLDKDYNKAFVMDEDNIEALYRETKKHVKDISIAFSCSDGSKNEPDTLKELYEFPNSVGRAIQSIDMQGERRGEGGREFVVSITMRHEYPTNKLINFRISGEENEVIPLGNRIEEILRNTFQWYSFAIAARGLIGLFFVAIGGGLIGSTIPLLPLSEENLVLPIVTALYLVIFGFGYFCYRRAFPAAVFAIGGGKQRQAAAVQFRKGLGAMVLTLLVTLVGALIVRVIWN